MDNPTEQVRHESTIEQAQKSIQKTLEEVGLIDCLPKEPGQKTIAILGAGVAVEVVPLKDYFLAHGLGTPKVIAFDLDVSSKILTEALFRLKDIDLEYHNKDITDPSSFGDEQYDMVLVRKPDIHRSPEGWRKAFKNGFDHLKTNGVFIATTDIYADFILKELKEGGELKKTYIIPEINKVHGFFNESDLFIATKGIK